MKSQIFLMAQLLMARNTKVSNLELKNAMHTTFSGDPSFALRQSEVSIAMNELYVEQNWHRSLNTTSVPGTPFYEYSLTVAPAVPQAVSQPTPAVQHVAATQPATTPIVKATGQLDTTLGKHVAYVSGEPAKFTQGDLTKSALKTQCFRQYNDNMFGLTHNNINYCTVEYYNKHLVS